MKSKISEEDEMNKRLENIKSLINRLSENAKFKKSGIDFKGLMAQEFVKTPILGQPVNRLSVRIQFFLIIHVIIPLIATPEFLNFVFPDNLSRCDPFWFPIQLN